MILQQLEQIDIFHMNIQETSAQPMLAMIFTKQVQFCYVLRVT